MAMAMNLPTLEAMCSWESVSDARIWLGVAVEEWTPIATALGDSELTSLVLLSAIEDDDYIEARNSAGLKPIRKAAANLLFAAVKGKFGVATKLMPPAPSGQ